MSDSSNGFDAWTVYCEVWHELFPRDVKVGLSPAALAEFADRVPTARSETTSLNLLKDLRYELSRLMAGAPVDNARVCRLVDRINELPGILPPGPKPVPRGPKEVG